MATRRRHGLHIDPADTDEAFETAYAQIARRVERLAHALDAAASRG